MNELKILKRYANRLLNNNPDQTAYWHYQKLIDKTNEMISQTPTESTELRAIKDYSIEILRDYPEASAFWHYNQVIDKINRLITYLQKVL